MPGKGVLPCNPISNFSNRIRTGYISKRGFIPRPHSKLTAAVVYALICQKHLQGMRIIPTESTCYTHLFRMACSYHIVLSFVPLHRHLIDDPETRTPDSQSGLPYFAGSYDLARNEIEDTLMVLFLSNVKPF